MPTAVKSASDAVFVQRTRRDSRVCRAAQFAGMEFSHYRSRANDL